MTKRFPRRLIVFLLFSAWLLFSAAGGLESELCRLNDPSERRTAENLNYAFERPPPPRLLHRSILKWPPELCAKWDYFSISRWLEKWWADCLWVCLFVYKTHSSGGIQIRSNWIMSLFLFIPPSPLFDTYFNFDNIPLPLLLTQLNFLNVIWLTFCFAFKISFCRVLCQKDWTVWSTPSCEHKSG